MMEIKSKIAKPIILIGLLQAFTTNELDQFIRFVESSYFNTDQRVTKLLKILKTIVITNQFFDEKKQLGTYQEIFPEEIIQERILNKKQKKVLSVKLSLLTKLAKKFLIIEGLKENPACESKLLNQKLLEKKQLSLLNKHSKTLSSELEKQKEKGIDYYAHTFQIEKGKMDYLFQKGLITKENNFSQLLESLDLFYLLNSLEIQSSIQSVLNLTQNRKVTYGNTEIVDMLTSIPKYNTHPLVELYLATIQILKSYTETSYVKFLDLLMHHTAFIPKNYLIDFYNVACNFCALQIRKGRVDYFNKVFELYQMMDVEDILLDKNNIQVIKLKNIITTSCHIRKFDWATKIINKYISFVKKEERESVYHLNIGGIEFYKSNYKKAISHLIRVDKINLVCDLDCRILLLKSYYVMDLKYDERTMQIFRSANRFLDTQQGMSISLKKSYKNFIQILINLYRVRHKVGKRTLVGVQNKLEKMDFVSDKKWLLEKMDSLK